MRYLRQRFIPVIQPIHYLVFALAGLVILDGLITHFVVGGGFAREGNPIMAPLVGGGFFLMLKVFGALLCAFILLDIYSRWARLAVISTSCLVACYIAIVIWNCYIFLIAA